MTQAMKIIYFMGYTLLLYQIYKGQLINGIYNCKKKNVHALFL